MQDFQPRFLTPEFVTAVKVEAKGGWWRDVLDDPDLLIMVRENYLSVYYLGGAVFKRVELVRSESGHPQLKACLDSKYLAVGESNEASDGDVSLRGTSFAPIARLPEPAFVRDYTSDTLRLIKRNISRRWPETKERSGVYHIAMNNPHVIDIELSVPGEYNGASTDHPQVDLVALEGDGDRVRLVFWEAKRRKSKELTDRGARRHVVQQIAEYREVAARNAPALEMGYAKLVKNLIEIGRLRNPARLAHHNLERVNADRVVYVGDPQAGLIVFGPNANKWAKTEAGRRLAGALSNSRKGECVLASDDPKAIGLPE